MVRVRALEPPVARLLDIGRRRSRTFRQEVEALEKGDLIVWLRKDVDLQARGQFRFLGRRSGWRLAHVSIRWPVHDYDAVSVLAHELWHGNETLQAPEVHDLAGFVALQRRIGMQVAPGAFETEGAERVERQVLRELYEGVREVSAPASLR